MVSLEKEAGFMILLLLRPTLIRWLHCVGRFRLILKKKQLVVWLVRQMIIRD